MGRIADAIEEIEEELEDITKELNEAREEIKVLDLRNEDLEVLAGKQSKVIKEYQGMYDYLEENHPEILMAMEVSERLEQA